MSERLMKLALALGSRARIVPAARLVLIYMAQVADDDGGSCFPAMETIGRDLGIDRTTVARAITELRKVGVVTQVSSGRKNVSNRYQINEDALCGDTLQKGTPPLCGDTLHKKPKRSAPLSGDTLHKSPGLSGDTLQKPAKRAALCSEVQHDSLTPKVIKGSPTLNVLVRQQRELPLVRVVPEVTAPPAAPSKVKPSGDAGFDAFYAAYPKHEAKADALAEWRKLLKAGVDPSVIMAGLESYQHNPDPQFIMQPRKWLHGRRWEDRQAPNLYAGRSQGAALQPKPTPMERARASIEAAKRRRMGEDGPTIDGRAEPLAALGGPR